MDRNEHARAKDGPSARRRCQTFRAPRWHLYIRARSAGPALRDLHLTGEQNTSQAPACHQARAPAAADRIPAQNLTWDGRRTSFYAPEAHSSLELKMSKWATRGSPQRALAAARSDGLMHAPNARADAENRERHPVRTNSPLQDSLVTPPAILLSAPVFSLTIKCLLSQIIKAAAQRRGGARPASLSLWWSASCTEF